MPSEKSEKTLVTYSEKLSEVIYDETHPFKPQRAKVFIELLRRYSLIDDLLDRIIEPTYIEESILYLFHEKEYVELLKKADIDFSLQAYERGLGTEDNPVFKGMFEFAFGCVACTYTCFDEVLRGNVNFAFNPLGGFHHAQKGQAMGFCYLNDIAVVGKYFQKMGKRIAIIDLDAHHGNGTQDAFYEDNDVLTISIHESGTTLFPGTGSESELGEGEGFGFNVNIPLLSGSDDDVYLFALDSVVPPLIDAFAPDLMVVLLGTDMHRNDPMSHLNVTANGFKKGLEIVRGLSERVIGLGAGGYSISKSPALWVVAFSVFTGRQIVDQFAGVVGGMMYGPEVDLMEFLDERFNVEEGLKKRCMRAAERVVEFIRKNVFPVLGAK